MVIQDNVFVWEGGGRMYYGVGVYPVTLRLYVTVPVFDAGTPITGIGQQVLGYLKHVSLIPGQQEFYYQAEDLLRRRVDNTTVLEGKTLYQIQNTTEDKNKIHMVDTHATTI